MREDWKQYTLGDICTITKGTSPTMKTAPGQYPLIVTAAQPSSSSEYQFDGEAVCIPMVSSTGHGHASLKRVHYASGKFAVANIIAAVHVKDSSSVSTKFLSLYLQHFKDDLIVTRMRGTANVSLSLAGLATIPVALPPIEEQKRIVDLIASLDDAIEAADAAAESARSATEAIQLNLAEMHGDSDTVFGDFVEIVSGYPFPSAGFNTERRGTPLVRIRDVKRGFSETYFEGPIPESAFVNDGDYLIGMDGDFTLTAWRGGPAALNQRVCMIGRVVPSCDPDFAAAWLEPHLKKIQEVTSFTTVKHLSVKTVKGLSFNPPSLDEQQEIAGVVEAGKTTSREAEKTRDSLRAVRSELLTVLLSGEHAISDSYDLDTAVQLDSAA